MDADDQLELKEYLSYKQVYNPTIHRDVGDTPLPKSPKRHDTYGVLERLAVFFVSLSAPNTSAPLTATKVYSLAVLFNPTNLNTPETPLSLQALAGKLQPLARLDVELVLRRLANEGVSMDFKGFWRLLEELAAKVLPDKDQSLATRLKVLLRCLGV